MRTEGPLYHESLDVQILSNPSVTGRSLVLLTDHLSDEREQFGRAEIKARDEAGRSKNKLALFPSIQGLGSCTKWRASWIPPSFVGRVSEIVTDCCKPAWLSATNLGTRNFLFRS